MLDYKGNVYKKLFEFTSTSTKSYPLDIDFKSTTILYIKEPFRRDLIAKLYKAYNYFSSLGLLSVVEPYS